MQYLSEVVANVNTGVLSRTYGTSKEEHAALLALAQDRGEVVMRPLASDDWQTWYCRPHNTPENQVGAYELTLEKATGKTWHSRFDAPATQPALF